MSLARDTTVRVFLVGTRGFLSLHQDVVRFLPRLGRKGKRRKVTGWELWGEGSLVILVVHWLTVHPFLDLLNGR